MFLQRLNLQQRKNFLELANYVINIEGESSKEELRIFENFRAEMILFEGEYQIKNKDLKDIITEFKSAKKATQKVVLYELMGLILSDKETKKKEEIIQYIQKEWNIRDYDIKKIKRWVQDFNDLLAEAYLNIEGGI